MNKAECLQCALAMHIHYVHNTRGMFNQSPDKHIDERSPTANRLIDDYAHNLVVGH